ncbi:class I SAM-dependent methyltransferase [Mycobacterium parmense]|uniref:SAM-dependent methyltransferase n=1 Tax=Mycobacterium parmense TaxID=185642 RepID=A0A7I7YS42_9MYCO|nr:class I SAM-dependent methyltransferase [Mycobacterium parmense]MCV7351966.1 methyltransferase domain-containing protein [Mycobacterium parmense]BBZ44560.1 SAM-dependent methyltransferase [Mycobacterium parmense]
MKCRHCGTRLENNFVDLGFAPPSNAYLRAEDLSSPEVHYPLRVKVCDRCWLVQTEDYARAEDLFSADYAYFSSTSTSWLDHAAAYVRMITDRLQLGPQSFVIEVASNDGYLLKNFVADGIPCLGIEPTASTAAAAEALGIPVQREFFGEALGRRLAGEGRGVDLILGNNVYAHVPDINDFTRGLAAVLKPEGTVTLEFPHLMPLIERTQFDTIYHEHFSYLSLTTVSRVFAAAGLRVWDVEELPTHGGSLRVYGCHAAAPISATDRVAVLLTREEEFGLTRPETYAAFQSSADRVKDDLVAFLIEQKRSGRRVAAYGAAAKGNTLLNYAGVRPDLLPYVCDAALSKQGKFMPGSHLPIRSPDALRENPPDFVVILPWNIAREVKTQLADLTGLGTRFVTAVPELTVV